MMATLTDAQIANAAKSAGVTGDNVAIAVAVAIAESGGNPRAHNAVPPDNSYGLWQINMLGSMGPARRKEFGLSSNDQLYDPNTNAKAMAKISSGGTNWKPWTTYTRGTYKLYMTRGRNAAKATGTDVSAGTPTQGVALGGGLSDLTDLLSDPALYRKAALYFLGFLCAIIGLVVLAGISSAPIPVGKLGKIVKGA